jgi:hypothetical protein
MLKSVVRYNNMPSSRFLTNRPPRHANAPHGEPSLRQHYQYFNTINSRSAPTNLTPSSHHDSPSYQLSPCTGYLDPNGMLPSIVLADMYWPAARSPGHSWRTGFVALCTSSACSCTSLPCGVSAVAIGLMTVRGTTKTENDPAQPAGPAAVRCGCEYLSQQYPGGQSSYFRKRSETEAVPSHKPASKCKPSTSVPSDLSGPEVTGHKTAATPA